MKRFKILLDGTEYTDPENWNAFTPTLERHPTYRTLLSFFSEGTLRLIKSAKNYVDSRYATDGPCTIEVEWQEYDYFTDSYETVYTLGTINTIEKYVRGRDFTEVGFEPNSFIMSVLNRDEVSVSLQSLVDMDGAAITPFTNETIELTLDNQVIDKSKSLRQTNIFSADIIVGGSEDEYQDEDIVRIPYVWDTEISDGGLNADSTGSIAIFKNEYPDSALVFSEGGSASFDLKLHMRILIDRFTGDADRTVGGNAELYYRINDDTPVLIDDEFSSNTNITIWQIDYEGTLNLSLNDGDKVSVYFQIQVLTTSTFKNRYSFTQYDVEGAPPVYVDGLPTLSITQSTIYPDTTAEVMLIWEFFLRLCQKITGRNDCFRSEYFGRTDGEVYQYAEDGPGALFALTNVKQLRGFPLSSNPINSSFLDAFKNSDALFCLGMGILYEDGDPFIQIEPLTYFFDKATPVTTFYAQDPGIEWSSLIEYVWGSVNAGFSKYKFDKNPTLGTPHSPKNYTVPYLSNLSNKAYEARCNFVASGHLIELLRRERYNEAEKKDTPYDNDIVIIAVKRDGDSFVRAKSEDFDFIENIDNPTTQYNLELTPARNLLRHAPLILCGLAKRIKTNPSFNEYLRFASGEANTEFGSLFEYTGATYILTYSGLSGTLVIGDVIFTGGTGGFIQAFTGTTITMLVTFGDPNTIGLSFNAGSGASGLVTDYAPDADVLYEGQDISRSQVEELLQEPLFDASELGTCTVKVNKSQRQLVKEGLKGRIIVVDNGVEYTGFIQSIKEIDLNRGTAELRFSLTSGLSPLYILEENGNIVLEETGDRIKEEQSV